MSLKHPYFCEILDRMSHSLCRNVLLRYIAGDNLRFPLIVSNIAFQTNWTLHSISSRRIHRNVVDGNTHLTAILFVATYARKYSLDENCSRLGEIPGVINRLVGHQLLNLLAQSSCIPKIKLLQLEEGTNIRCVEDRGYKPNLQPIWPIYS